MSKQSLKILDLEFTIHSLDANCAIPEQVTQSACFFIAKTADELSIVCPSDIELDSDEQESGWVAFEVMGPLGFSLTGIMAQISAILANAAISIFAISTFDTDYILVKSESADAAKEALTKHGYRVYC